MEVKNGREEIPKLRGEKLAVWPHCHEEEEKEKKGKGTREGSEEGGGGEWE